MRQLWVAISSVLLAFGSVACGGPAATPVDSGTPNPPTGNNNNKTDAGTSANFVASDAGWTFEPAAGGGGYLYSDPYYTAVITESAADRAVFCAGGIPEHYALATVITPGGFPTGSYSGEDAYVEYGDPTGGWKFDDTGATITVTAANANTFSGTFQGTTFIDQDDANVPGSFSGGFSVEACPTFTGTGDNQANGALGFEVTHAIAVLVPATAEDPEYWTIFLSNADISGAVCAMQAPLSAKAVWLSIYPADTANPAGTYEIGVDAELFYSDIGAMLPPLGQMTGLGGSITVAGTPPNLTGTYEVSGNTGLGFVLTDLSGTFSATSCPQ